VAEHGVSGVFAADHPSLAGHFPGRPLVPAVVLLDFAARALRDALARPVRVTAVPAAKFLAPLAPGQPFRLELALDRAGSARFTIAADGRELAHGRLDYAEGAA
jgi:3-hydroxyacyl-[acyl-carrier-protein] dehydratase